MAMHRGFDLSRFKKISSDAKSTTMRHSNGHEVKIVHSGLSPGMRAQVDALPMAEAPAKMARGGMVKKMAEGGDPTDFQAMDPILHQRPLLTMQTSLTFLPLHQRKRTIAVFQTGRRRLRIMIRIRSTSSASRRSRFRWHPPCSNFSRTMPRGHRTSRTVISRQRPTKACSPKKTRSERLERSLAWSSEALAPASRISRIWPWT